MSGCGVSHSAGPRGQHGVKLNVRGDELQCRKVAAVPFPRVTSPVWRMEYPPLWWRDLLKCPVSTGGQGMER